jgi:hypothetical protein
MSSFVVHETWKCCRVGNCLHHNWLDTVVGLGMQFISAHNLRDTGAVASVRAAEIYGLEILMDGIQDDCDNVTRFLMLAREPVIPRNDRPFKVLLLFLQLCQWPFFQLVFIFRMNAILLPTDLTLP